MSQQEVIQFLIEHYNYEKESRKLKTKNNEYYLHITKNNFELHEERKEVDSKYIKNIAIKEDINVEVIRSFNFKEIYSYEVLKECVEATLIHI